MRTRVKLPVIRLVCVFIITLAVCLAADAAFALLGLQPSGKRLAAVTGLAFCLLLLPWPEKLLKAAAAVLPVLCILGALGGYAAWRSTLTGGTYVETDNGKAALYGGKNVMLIVPHEDDDLNLLGGVIEQYMKYGSQLRVVFVTNGDCYINGSVRINEALRMYADLGLPEENVIFLGYGDTWRGDTHIYNAPPDQPMTSFGGYTEPYATQEHPAYREGRPYTRRHLTEDLESVILEYRPDVLFACDYDYHADHQAVSLFFEEVMGHILATQPDYRPQVFKGFAYCTAFYSAPDYYQANISSSWNESSLPYLWQNGVFRWNDRIRFPVLASTLSRSMLGSEAYRLLDFYTSQVAVANARSVINGDKVFWYRDCNSLSYTATVSASSGDAWRLNDFKLGDCSHLIDDSVPQEGTWTPSPEDTEKTAVLELAEPADLTYLRFYGAYPGRGRVLDALVRFDSGTELHTGPFPDDGGSLDLEVDEKAVSRVSVTLLETEGEAPGISELELYSREPEPDLKLIKLINDAGDFVYDYYISGGQEDFSLYTEGCPRKLTGENYRVTVEGGGCSAQFLEGKLRVTCPWGKSCTVKVESLDGSVSDSVRISSPSYLFLLGQNLERAWPDSTLRVQLINFLDRF